ncbi:hypothetical protein [Streptodolium elevatio]|uniref:Minor tail protein n=1 Tax=Streptodolium elevatio TaxID=3157996 RepID=A0ABV3DM79_9ACTN
MPQYTDTINDQIARLERQVRDLTTQVASIPTDRTSAPWLPVASLGSGWTDHHLTDSSWELIGLRVEPGGLVRLRGAVMRSGSVWPAAGFTLLTLPADLLPVASQAFTTAGVYAGGFVHLEFQTGGAVVVRGWTSGGSGAAGTAIGLDGLSYRIS